MMFKIMKSNILFFYSFFFLATLLLPGCDENLRFFAGGFTVEQEKGFSVYDLNSRNSIPAKVSDWDAGPSPAYFCFDKKRNLIYLLNGVREFRGLPGSGVTTMKYNPETDSMEKMGEILVPYGGACYISLSAERQYLFFASYSSGSAAVVKLDGNGIPERVTDAVLFAPESPGLSHPHMISPDPSGKYVYMTDLGLDRILKYEFDATSGRLILPSDGITELLKGSGPRHFEFNKDGSKMYVINELGSTIMVFNINESGNLSLQQIVPTVTKGFEGKNACADIHLGRDCKYLYGSNRGENSIVVFRVSDEGTLTLAGHVTCGGDWPRNFVIDPSGKHLVVGNERSNHISVFRINNKTGIPEGPLTHLPMKKPACIKFWN